MSRYEKLYERIKRNPRDVELQEIDALLIRGGGFEKRKESSHNTYSHHDLEYIITNQIRDR